jgi:predicted O-methyltransferase YrrM
VGAPIPWQARARQVAQRFGVEPRNFRRFRWLHKARVVRQYDVNLLHNARFVLLDPEPHNFTWEVDNRGELEAWVSEVSGCDAETARRLVQEAEDDAVLNARLRSATKGRWLWTKARPPFGKRFGWYALARVLHPRLIVETGVHDGLGSLLLLRALERNAEEGYEGRLISFDVNPAAGWLVADHARWEFRREASQDGLSAVLARGADVDMFIYDGWHSYEHEEAELQQVARHLAPNGVLLSDDAHVTGAIADVCAAHELRYFAVEVRPKNHFDTGTVLAAGRRG